MAAVFETLRSMKLVAKKLLIAAVMSFCLPMMAAAQSQSQSFGTGSGTNLSSVEYFDPPNEQKIKVRVTGAEMTALPGMIYNVKNLKIEQFGTNGLPEMVVTAPQCTYTPDGVASSPGPLEMEKYLRDGKVHVQGEGFMWVQTNLSLDISNQQRTVIKMGNWKLPTKNEHD